jgi:hypothetical protein
MPNLKRYYDMSHFNVVKSGIWDWKKQNKTPNHKTITKFDGRCLQHGFALHKFPKKSENGLMAWHDIRWGCLCDHCHAMVFLSNLCYSQSESDT